MWLQFSRFTLVGVVATLCHFTVLIILVEQFAWSAVLATVPAFVSGAIVGYFLNTWFTFQQGQSAQALLRYLVIATLTLMLNLAVMWLLHDHYGLHYLFAQIMGTGAAFMVNFFANRRWTFNHA